MAKRHFGSIRQLPSKVPGRPGRYQARYQGPDGQNYTARTEDDRPLTFTTERKAAAYLDRVHGEIQAGTWRSPGRRKPADVPTFRDYAEAWLSSRDLEDTTRDHYDQLLRDHIYPHFGSVPITEISAANVRAWHGQVAKGRPTARAHAYGLLRTIMNTAVADDVIVANPCRVRGGGQSKRVVQIKPATLPELAMIVEHMPEHQRVMVLLASWCGLRFGELAELRRSDIDLANGLIQVRRGVVRTKQGRKVKGPKSEAGRRTVHIPPHLLDAVKDHLRQHAQPGPNGLLFPGKLGHLAPATFYGRAPSKRQAGYGWYAARAAARRPDLRFHDLRHTGAVLAASTGATLAELMARLGHSTPAAAMRYQHAAADRDKIIAERLSELANGTNGGTNGRGQAAA